MAEAKYAEAVAQKDVISQLLGKSFAVRTHVSRRIFCSIKPSLHWQTLVCKL